jgi:uncharacterized membrane protein YGL010W
MKTLNDHLSQYAAYHRDPRNIATHFVGIPMIVAAVATLTSRPAFIVDAGPLGATALSPAVLIILGAIAFYARLDVRFALVMAVQYLAAGLLGAYLAAQETLVWLGAGLGLFIVGWVIQFVGHYFEGKKPAFVDDLVGLLVGPLFVTAEVAFALKMRDEVRAEIEKRSGPVKKRDLSIPVVRSGAASPQ